METLEGVAAGNTHNREALASVCPVCMRSDTRIEAELSELLNLIATKRRVVACRHCGFRFVHPFLSKSEVEELYNTEAQYFEAYVSGSYLENVEEKLGYYSWVQERIESRLKRKGSVLDIGSATGHFLAVFKRNGWRTTGLEVSDWCRAYCLEEFGIGSVKGTVADSEFPEEQFDVITINHVLEHLDSPVETLKKVSNWLRPDGLLCIEVPNEFNDLVFAFSNNWGRRRMYNDTDPILHHQLFFRPKHLRAVMEAAGWAVLETRTFNWETPIPCHLFRSTTLCSIARNFRKTALAVGSLVEKGPFIFCLAAKKVTADSSL